MSQKSSVSKSPYSVSKLLTGAGYDEPNTLRYTNPSTCLMGPDGEQRRLIDYQKCSGLFVAGHFHQGLSVGIKASNG